jgi:hypothetical protein
MEKYKSGLSGFSGALTLVLAVAVFFLPGPAAAKSLINKSFFSGVAIKGYDPVAYFNSGGPVKGKSEFTVTWKDAKWNFSTAQNKAAFAKEPERYAPQYGGYCAWAVAEGGTAGIDPHSWRIVDGKLYLNYNKEIQAKWEKDIPGNIERADKNWPGVVE